MRKIKEWSLPTIVRYIIGWELLGPRPLLVKEKGRRLNSPLI